MKSPDTPSQIQPQPAEIREERRLLERWRREARQAAEEHATWQDYFNTRDQRIGVPAALLTFAVSSSLFVSLTTDPSFAAKAAVFGVSAFTTLLTGLRTYFKDAERAVCHQQFWHEYSELAHDIESLQAESSGDVAASEIKLRRQELQQRRNKIDQHAPSPPARQLGILKTRRSPACRHTKAACGVVEVLGTR